MLKSSYKEIDTAFENYDLINGWEKLKNIVENPDNQDKPEYTDFFILALNAVISFSDYEKGHKYYDIIKKLKPDFDTKLFDVAFLKADKKISESEKLLKPVNSIEVLNSYLMLLSEQKRYDEIETLLLVNTFSYNTSTYTILSIMYLEKAEFGNAIKFSEKLIEDKPNSPVSYFIRGIIEFWKNLLPHNNKPCLNMPIFFVKLYLTNEQSKNLKTSLEYFIKANELAKSYKNHEWISRSLIGCMTVSDLINSPNTISYCDKLLEIEEYFPAIFFMTERNIPINNDVIEKIKAQVLLSQASISTVFALIKYYVWKKLYKEASVLADKYKNELKENYYEHYITTMFLMALAQKPKNTKLAETLIEQSTLCDETKARLLLQLSSKTRKLSKFIEVKNKFPTPANYLNLCIFCDKKKKWADLEKYSLEWYEKHHDLLALEYKLISLIPQYKHQECLQGINELEKISELSLNLKRIKIDCYLGLSQFKEALILMKDIGKNQLSEKDTFTIANVQIFTGNNLDAISTLKIYLENNPKSKEVTRNLVALLIAEKQVYDAIEYQKRIAKQYPRDKNLLSHLMNLSINSDNTKIFQDTVIKLTSLDKTGKYIKPIKMNDKDGVKEFLEMIEYWRKKDEEFSKQFLPVHSVPLYNNQFILSKLFYKQ